MRSNPELEATKLKAQEGNSLDYCYITKCVVKLRSVQFFKMTFERISQELVLRHILVYTDVSISDVCNVAQTSSLLNEVIKNGNSLWKKKFGQR